MKKLLYVIIGIVVLYLILAMAGKSTAKIERQITINKSADVIKGKLGDLKFFHDKWSPWTEKDPAMVTNYSGDAGTIGHKMDWVGNKTVGTGTMEIIAFSDDTLIEKLSFKGMGDAKAYYVVNGKENATNVTWGLEMKIPFFKRPMMMFMSMDKMMGPDFENGLAKFKKVMEETKEDVASEYEINETEWPEATYIGKKETVSLDKLGEFFGKNFQAIVKELDKNKIQPEAAPSAIYTLYDEKGGKADVAAVFKVAKGVKLKDYESFTIPAGKVFHIAYYGDYSKSAKAHMAMDEYMKGKGVTHASVVEEYVTDPMSEKDTSKWLTNIYYIIK